MFGVHPRVRNTKEPSISAAGFWRSTPSPTAKTRYAGPLRTLSTTNTSSYGRSFVLWSFVDRLCRDWNPLIPAILGCTTGIQTWLVDTFQLFDLHKQIPFWCPFGGANPNEMLTLLRAQVAQPGGMGKSIEASTWLQGWGPTASSQRFLQRTFDPSPLRLRAVICDLKAPVFLCRRWAFEIYWTCIYMHGWFYYMIVGDTAFYNAHDKVIAFHSM